MHPERIFSELSRLAGVLYTFAGEGHPKDLPLYVHDELSSTFSQLEEQLRSAALTSVQAGAPPTVSSNRWVIAWVARVRAVLPGRWFHGRRENREIHRREKASRAYGEA